MVAENTNIIIIGPVTTGKSTQGQLIAKALNKRSVSLDSVANDYYEANGFGPSQFQKAYKEKGFLEAYRLWCPSLAFAAQQIVKDYTDCVIDFGAGHSHYEDEILFEGIKKSLAHYPNIFLLLPSIDLDKSVSILRQRSIDERKRDWIHDGYDFIEHWVKDDCNRLLSTKIFYTEGKTPEETRDEILESINVQMPNKNIQRIAKSGT